MHYFIVMIDEQIKYNNMYINYDYKNNLIEKNKKNIIQNMYFILYDNVKKSNIYDILYKDIKLYDNGNYDNLFNLQNIITDYINNETTNSDNKIIEDEIIEDKINEDIFNNLFDELINTFNEKINVLNNILDLFNNSTDIKINIDIFNEFIKIKNSDKFCILLKKFYI